MNSILLVDDETIICAEFARTLEGLGFEVEVASNVEAGISRAEAAQFDAILVEFNLRSERRSHPRTGNGLQLVRQLRALDVNTPVLMFTAMEGELYETASLDAGADDFVLKTTSIPSLVSRLRVHIRKHREGLGERTNRGKVSM
jgi:OmpR-family two-component system manganese-sensing response regulator